LFTTAERKTDVTIGLIHLFKPRVSTETEFEGYFDMFEEYQRQDNGLMPYNDIVDIVNRYIGAVKMFNEVIEASDKMNKLIKSKPETVIGCPLFAFYEIEYENIICIKAFNPCFELYTFINIHERIPILSNTSDIIHKKFNKIFKSLDYSFKLLCKKVRTNNFNYLQMNNKLPRHILKIIQYYTYNYNMYISVFNGYSIISIDEDDLEDIIIIDSVDRNSIE